MNILLFMTARDMDAMENIGTLPSGAPLLINKVAANADLLVSEGFIETHFFAGFSGGRKASFLVLPPEKTIMYNHAACNIHDPHSRLRAFWKEIQFMKICSLLQKLLESALS